MQFRMKTHPLPQEKLEALLQRSPAGTLATVNADGTPYAVPVHFVRVGDKVYVHGLPAGQKLENIQANPRVCLTVWEMFGLLPDEEGRPCETNTAYESAVLQGSASLVDDEQEKRHALAAVVAKYMPELTGAPIPENMLRGTAVLRIEPDAVTGKYWP